MRWGIVIGLLAGCLGAAPAQASERIAVFNIWSQPGLRGRAGGATEALAEEMSRLTEKPIVRHRELKKALGVDPGSAVRGCNQDLLCLSQIGNACAVQRMVIGKMWEQGDALVIDLSLVDVSKAIIARRVDSQVPDDPAGLSQGVRELARRLLTPADAPAKLIVRADVRGAKVRIDGRSRGEVPLRIEKMPAGEVSVSVEAEGYQSVEQKVTLQPGETSELDLRLRSDAVTPKRASRWVRAAQRPLTLVVAGGGVAMAIAAGVTGALGASAEKDARNLLDDGSATQLEVAKKRDDARKRYDIANIMIGLSGAFFGSALSMFVMDGVGILWADEGGSLQLHAAPNQLSLDWRF